MLARKLGADESVNVATTDPADLADAILQAITSPALRQQAAEMNAGIIAHRADASQIQAQIKGFDHSFGLPG